MARVKGISVSDFVGASNTGILGEQISVTLTLDEAITATNGSINSSTVIPSISVGGAGITAQEIPNSLVNFIEYSASKKALTFSVTLPSGLSGNLLSLTGITISNVTLVGATTDLLSGNTNLELRLNLVPV